MVENYKEYIIKLAKETGFIRSTLEKVYRLLNVLEWINSRPDLKDLLALKGGTAINTAVFNFPRLSVDIDLDFTQNIKKEQMKIENIEKIKRQDIVTKLLPTLRDRNPRKINLDEMKKDVGKYLKDILVIDSNVNEFYNKFQNGIFEPEIIFNDKEIIERVKVHPMRLWKLNNK